MYIFLDRDDLGHVYIYSQRARLIDPQLIGDRFGELYKFSAQPMVDDSDEEQEAPEVAVAPRVQSRVRWKRGVSSEYWQEAQLA